MYNRKISIHFSVSSFIYKKFELNTYSQWSNLNTYNSKTKVLMEQFIKKKMF